MTPDEKNRLVSNYGDRDRDPDNEAWESLNDLVVNAPEDAWSIILEICDRAPTSVVEYLGCCQLEDLLAQSARKFRTQVVAAISTSEGLRRALLCARYFGVPPEIVGEIDAALQDAGAPSIRPEFWTYHPRGHAPN